MGPVSTFPPRHAANHGCDPVPLPPVNPDGPLPVPTIISLLNPTAEQLTSLYEISFSGADTQRLNLEERLAEIQGGLTGLS